MLFPLSMRGNTTSAVATKIDLKDEQKASQKQQLGPRYAVTRCNNLAKEAQLVAFDPKPIALTHGHIPITHGRVPHLLACVLGRKL